MIEFLLLLERKLPPGFFIMIERGVVGFNITVKHGGIQNTFSVPFNMITDLSDELTERFDSTVLEDAVEKIRKHPKYPY